MPVRLRAEEGRVVGCLVEKQLTTPQQYPLSLNALVLACNQTSNRDPVVSYDEGLVEAALASLKSEGAVRFVLPSHGRSVTRYRHVLDEKLGLDERRLALLAGLLLRGPQTAAELRSRTSRMAQTGSVDSVESDLQIMAGAPEPLVARLDRRPGQKEERWAQLVADEHVGVTTVSERPSEPGRLNLSPDEVLTTTRSVRRRLDLDRPVERSIVVECLEIALQAPSGGNRQAWHWIVVTDPEKKAAVGRHYRDGFESAYGGADTSTMPDAERRMVESARWLSEHMGEAPVLVIPCQWGRLDGAPAGEQAGYWGSILPAVWSFMLALRSRGLGSAWTTLHLRREREVAEILGIPYDRCTQAGLFPVAYTQGTDFGRAVRRPLDEVVHWDAW